MLTRNDYKLDVRNGQRATVESADPFGLIDVRLDGGEHRRINVAAYNHIDYGWATTTHKAQGMTVERASVYGFANESMASQQSTYVQISRAKAETKLHIVAGERGVEREGLSVKMEPQQRTEAPGPGTRTVHLQASGRGPRRPHLGGKPPRRGRRL